MYQDDSGSTPSLQQVISAERLGESCQRPVHTPALCTPKSDRSCYPLVTVLPTREENGMKVYEAIVKGLENIRATAALGGAGAVPHCSPSPAGIVTKAIEARFRPG